MHCKRIVHSYVLSCSMLIYGRNPREGAQQDAIATNLQCTTSRSSCVNQSRPDLHGRKRQQAEGASLAKCSHHVHVTQVGQVRRSAEAKP